MKHALPALLLKEKLKQRPLVTIRYGKKEAKKAQQKSNERNRKMIELKKKPKQSDINFTPL